MCFLLFRYGQTAFLYFMKMKCAVDIVSVLDNDLRSTLHWACYQGHGDTAKLLLYLGGDEAEADDRHGLQGLRLRRS